MGDIVIPEEKFEEFLRSLLVTVTKEREKLIAEMRAGVEASEALFHARLEEALARRTRAHEEELERRARAAEERVELIIRAAEDQIACKRREAEDEIARRLRHTLEAEREPAAVIPAKKN